MDDKQTEKTGPPKPNGQVAGPRTVSKSFMAVGPTLHYSHQNVQGCWFLAVLAYGLSCLFWSRILTGSFWSFDAAAASPQLWHLGRFIVSGVSIFEYPWQILVLGLLMGILAVGPVLVSQLMSLGYSLPFILAVFFLANLPGFAICLLISCIAVACRPLRFRSRFTAIALCMAPQLVYWGLFGRVAGVEPIKWGFSFSPWICAWLVGLAVAGLVLGIGHFTRYRPGLVGTFIFVVCLTAVGVFEAKIGFDELDYQLYVAKNNPENVEQFHEHSITEALDKTITDPMVKKYLAGFFYPSEPIPLREELKREMQVQLSRDRWPSWFTVPKELNYQAEKQRLLQHYDLFISRRSKSRRMPIALYYRGLLSEYSPDIQVLEQKEVLCFYSDYPYERSREIWYRLYSEFDHSGESIEARWRIAKHWAGQGRFEQAEMLLVQAQDMVTERLKLLEKEQPQVQTLFRLFHPPAETAMTQFNLAELQRRVNQLRNLISERNRTETGASAKRLARFVMLNPHSRGFSAQLDELLSQTEDNDLLRDNVLLARTKLVADEQLRAERLAGLHKEFQDTDGGMQALYELGLLKISLWHQQDESNPEQKKKYLAQTREILTDFIKLYPESVFSDQVKKNLADLPKVE